MYEGSRAIAERSSCLLMDGSREKKILPLVYQLQIKMVDFQGYKSSKIINFEIFKVEDNVIYC